MVTAHGELGAGPWGRGRGVAWAGPEAVKGRLGHWRWWERGRGLETVQRHLPERSQFLFGGNESEDES